MKNLLKLICLLLLLNSCKKENQDYPMEKPVWDMTDYENVKTEILFGTPEGEKFPGFSQNTEVFLRLTDKTSISKILDDNSLGIQYRQEYSEKLFNLWRDLVEGYSTLDKQDKFIYPMELVKLRDWGYYIQIKYFKLGNEEILKKAVSEDDVKSVLNENEQTVVNNFIHGISFLTQEHALNEEAAQEYAKILKDNYTLLIETFPNADYLHMESTIDDILKKVKTNSIKESLNEIKKAIEATKAEDPVKEEI